LHDRMNVADGEHVHRRGPGRLFRLR
jgi:hypothetical protein